VSRTQARFDGSDRQARGRLMKALVDGAVSRDAASMVMKCSAERAERLVEALAADGLVVIDEYTMCLP
jgi:A/G-specific adenine glycosylase